MGRKFNRSVPNDAYEEGKERKERKPYKTLATGRKPGSGYNPNSWNLPRLLTPETMTAIIADVEIGLSVQKAFIHNGFSNTTFPYWMEKAEKGDQEAQVFVTSVHAAYVEFEAVLLRRLREAEEDGNLKAWQRLCWLLERCRQDTYALQNKIQADVKVEAVSAREALQAEARTIIETAALEASVIDALPSPEAESEVDGMP
jgi:hypothetical protein